jgi:predicted secreted acid phosphatase
MIARLLGAGLAFGLSMLPQWAAAWGQEGHSIVAEIGERRLDAKAREAVANILGPGTSLASVSSWADGYRADHRETARWHFVDMARARQVYDPAVDCRLDEKEGDCTVNALERLREVLACGTNEAARRDALKFAVHFVGDIHQPLHAAGELRGGNDQKITGKVHTATCGRPGCEVTVSAPNLHSLWDGELIRWTVYDWGTYVERLEERVLKGNDFQMKVVNEKPEDWAMQSHAIAAMVWPTVSASAPMVIDDAYYQRVLPVLDQQLALGGVRLARYLNDAFSASCPLRRETKLFAGGSETLSASASNLGELKKQLEAYWKTPLPSGLTQYQADQTRVAEVARAYLRTRLASGVSKPAVVLDIDETSLDNLPQMAVNDFGYIRAGDCKLEATGPKSDAACGTQAWEEQGGAAAIPATLALYQEFKGKVAFFFITGRRDSEAAWTEANLAKAGYAGWEKLITKPKEWPSSVSTVNFKATERARLVSQGYTIIANIGDQPSDLAGGYAERVFLMPNPFYRLP